MERGLLHAHHPRSPREPGCTEPAPRDKGRGDTQLNCQPNVEDGDLTFGPKLKSVVFPKTNVAVFPLENVSTDYF